MGKLVEHYLNDIARLKINRIENPEGSQDQSGFLFF
jgi:hypothetical protein